MVAVGAVGAQEGGRPTAVVEAQGVNEASGGDGMRTAARTRGVTGQDGAAAAAAGGLELDGELEGEEDGLGAGQILSYHP